MGWGRWAAAVGLLATACTPSFDRPASPRMDPLAGMLLSETEVNELVAPLVLTKSYDYRTLFDVRDGDSYTPARCLDVPASTMSATYDGSGFREVRGIELAETGDGGRDVDQGVVRFDTAAAARAFVAKSVESWRQCAGKEMVLLREDRPPWHLTMMRPVVVGEVTVVEVVGVAAGETSSHALRAIGDVVIDVRATRAGASEHAVAVVDAIAGRNRL